MIKGGITNYWQEAMFKKQKNESLEGNYLNSKWKSKQIKTTMTIINEHFPNAFDKNSKFLEIGCNLAKNLRESLQLFNCHCTGIDINEEAIEKNKIFFGDMGEFILADLRIDNVLNNYEDNYFDFGWSSGFLMHIERGSEKTKLIENFTRVCKKALIYELYSETLKDGHYDNEYVLSYDDYKLYHKDIELIKIDEEKFGIYLLNKGL